MLEIEQSFGSNICRCTGYRSILDAFKSFAKDAPRSIEIPDIENLRLCHGYDKSCEKTCAEEGWCIVPKSEFNIDDVIIKINLKDGKTWYKVYKLVDVLKILRTESNKSYKLICGNTAKGKKVKVFV